MSMIVREYGMGADQTGQEAVILPVVRGASSVEMDAAYACQSNRDCVPLFQRGVAVKDGKCGCEFMPESAMMGVFFLPIMPALYLIQKQCGALGQGGHQGIDGQPPTTICKTLNSWGMILPALGVTVFGWYWIYKQTIGK